MWYGNNPMANNGGCMPPRFPEEQGMNEVEFDHFYSNKAYEWMAAHPRRYLDLCRVRAFRFFGGTPDSIAARYWWPTAQNDHDILELDHSKSRTNAACVRANAYLARNLKYDTRMRRVVAPLMLLALLWALFRFRQYALVTLPVCCYCLGLSATACVERYRIVSDPLMLIPLAALLSDMVVGTGNLGRGRILRWVKAGLAIAAVTASLCVQKSRLEQSWYNLPPMVPPAPTSATGTTVDQEAPPP
jgi:hypothetical protein